MSKYEISAHSLSRWGKLKPFSSSPFLLFLSARLTRNWLHFLDSTSRSRYIWSTLPQPRPLFGFHAMQPGLVCHFWAANRTWTMNRDKRKNEFTEQKHITIVYRTSILVTSLNHFDRPWDIEMNITGTLPPTGNLKANLKASPSLFTHAKSA